MAEIDLKGRPIIVTGGGSGLGKQMTLSLAGHGANVVVAEVNPQHAEELMAEARKEGVAERVHYIATDVTNPESAKATVQQTIAKFGTVFGLVNCAGRGYPLSEAPAGVRGPRLWQETAAGWNPVIALNLNGPFFMANAAVNEMMAKRQGRIVNVTTSYGTMQRAGQQPYGATKAALETLTMAWADELKEYGVTVNVLVPGGAADTRLLPDKPGEGLRSKGNVLVEPKVMRAPIVWLMSDLSSKATRRRYIASWWDAKLPLDQAAAKAGAPAGWAVPEGQGGMEQLRTGL